MPTLLFTAATDVGSENMIEMFEFPLRRTYELIGDQLQKAKRAKKATMKVCTDSLYMLSFTHRYSMFS